VNVTGIMAQFGRGLMQDVSNQMFQRFTEAVRVELEKAPAAEPAAAGPAPGALPASGPSTVPAVASAPPLEVSSFVVRRPAFWVAVFFVVGALIWFWSR
jgi:hypothetical protein